MWTQLPIVSCAHSVFTINIPRCRPDLVAIAYEDFCRFHKPKVHTLRKEGLERSDSGPRFGAKSVVPLVVQFDSTEVSHNHGRKYSVYTPTAMSGALNKLHRGTKGMFT